MVGRGSHRASEDAGADEGLAALIARLEAATEGSRELDARIYAFIHGETFSHMARREFNDYDPLSYCWHDDKRRRFTCWRDKAYSRSIDAALTLVPTTCDYEVRLLGTPDGKTWTASGVLWWAQGRDADRKAWQHRGGNAPTPALSLCIAALKARLP